MGDNRPDIQVLEDRVSRLKCQIATLKHYSYYSSTVKRLTAVSEDIAECLNMLYDVIEANTRKSTDAPSDSSIDLFTSQTEFSNLDDLLTDFLDNPIPKYAESRKELIRLFANRFTRCVESSRDELGILQIDLFCIMLNNWYIHRYTTPYRNPKFYFKVEKISTYIDQFILAGGYALNRDKFSTFLNDCNTWIDTLSTPNDSLYPAPYEVLNFDTSKFSNITPEAIFIERLVKPLLYCDGFYADQMHSVEQIVVATGLYTSSDLEFESILNRNRSKLTLTSGFDLNRYK